MKRNFGSSNLFPPIEYSWFMKVRLIFGAEQIKRPILRIGNIRLAITAKWSGFQKKFIINSNYIWMPSNRTLIWYDCRGIERLFIRKRQTVIQTEQRTIQYAVFECRDSIVHRIAFKWSIEMHNTMNYLQVTSVAG